MEGIKVGDAVFVQFADGREFNATVESIRDVEKQPLVTKKQSERRGKTLVVFKLDDLACNYKSGYPGVSCEVRKL